MSVFEAIDSKILEEIIQHLKSSTCYIDTLPTSFFKSVLNCLEADLLEVVNTLLLSGTFPNSLKTAVVKPLLKKSKWTSMTCGVPQDSILTPLLFCLYMLPLSQIMRKNQIAYHSYADDTQIYLALSPNDYRSPLTPSANALMKLTIGCAKTFFS